MDITKYRMKQKYYIQKKNFLEKLGYALIEQHIASRTHMPKTNESRIIVKSIKEKYQESHEDCTLQNVPVKRAKCQFYVPKNENKTSTSYISCN